MNDERLTKANRPGLNALAYRVGTHASFLETMVARLSSLSLEIEPEDGSGEKQKIYPLKALTTRQADDPALALLDSWATVADVLTFYQERIANEGYLRTATERRSILELARLVGYKLRPGVAASVYLAFTLDNGYQMTIPAGARAQSIPAAPGEFPQSFETAEPLPARDVWNDLKPRLTRPQKISEATTELYFEGIATNLKPNDPLLFVFSQDNQILFRIGGIEVQAAQNRTKVVLQPLSLAQQTAALQRAITKYLKLDDFGVAEGEMAREVTGVLQGLQDSLKPKPTLATMAPALDKALLPLQEKHQAAKEYSKLEPWLGGLVAALKDIAAMLVAQSQVKITAVSPLAPATAAAVNGQKEPAVTRLAGLLEPLARPPSLQPANSLQLPRNVARTYAAESDVATKLLTALRPALAPYLYAAWQKLPLTVPSPVEIYALRTRASVFGHNAPATESFELRVSLVDREEGGIRVEEGIRITIVIGDHSVVYPPDDEPPLLLENGEFDIEFPAVNETIFFTLTVDDLLPVEMRFRFAHRPIVLSGRLDSEGRLHVSSSGGNPVGLRISSGTVGDREGPNPDPEISIQGEINTQANIATETADVVWLDTAYGQIVPGSWVVLERPYPQENGNQDNIPKTVIAQVTEVNEQSRADYGLPGMKSTRLTLDRNWLDPENDSFAVIRGTAVYAQSEPLTLSEAPIDPVAEAVCGRDIELGGLYDGLEAGRWLIISGERTDVKPEMAKTPDTTPAAEKETTIGIKGIPATELVMLAGVEQDFDEKLPGEKTHTRLLLANGLAYCYKRDTVTIYGNVAKATHGEIRSEVLGSGDGSKRFQAFTLKQPPLTYISASTSSGIESTLTVRVNDLKWHEADTLAGLERTDHTFTTQTDNEDKTTVIFGDGRYGARLPTGVENIKASYRNGIGQPGNVAAGQISLLVTRTLGMKGVVNPLRASGGADHDSRDQARRNAPLAVTALDRLVSVQDYTDFARTFAGIGKTSAIHLSDGRLQVVHLTIAGVDDIPIDKSSDLYRNLRRALHQFGDPYQLIQVDIRQRKLLIISGKVRVLPDYLWKAVAPQIRAVLLDAFSFDRRELGQDVLRSEVISAIQAVSGVAYVDIDILDAVAEDASLSQLTKLGSTLELKSRIVAEMARINLEATDPDEHIQPAQLVFLSLDVPDTLILTELP